MTENKPKKLTKSEILKEKYGFNRNKGTESDFEEKGQKEDMEILRRARYDYAYNSDTSKKKIQQY